MSRGRRVAAVLVVLVVALGGLGCAADRSPEPPGSTTTTSSPSPTMSPTTETAPTYPAAATTNDLEGQKAFVEYWFDVYNFGRRTGDTAAVKAISEQSDKNAILWQELDLIYAAGGRLEGNQYELVEIVRAPATPEGLAFVTIGVVMHPGEEVAADGARTPVEGLDEKTYTMTISYRDGRWLMLEVNQL